MLKVETRNLSVVMKEPDLNAFDKNKINLK